MDIEEKLGANAVDDGDVEGEADEEVEELKRQLAELEREEKETAAAKTAAGGATSTTSSSTTTSKLYSPPTTGGGGATAPSVDENSIIVKRLNENTTPDELQRHFKSCGTVKRITIICDKWTGKSKGYAYIEFMEQSAVELALSFNESNLNGNVITVELKRQNVPSFMLRGGRGRGRGGFPRGGYRGRGGGGYRGRGGFSPY